MQIAFITLFIIFRSILSKFQEHEKETWEEQEKVASLVIDKVQPSGFELAT